MHRLLIAYDGSPPARRALEFALRFARALPDVSLHLVHAHEAPDTQGAIAIYVTQEKMADFQREHSESILADAARCATTAGVTCEIEILVGPVAESIASRAAALGCEFIVMGTRGMGPLGNLVMGSTATQVVHHATVPVTLVK